MSVTVVSTLPKPTQASATDNAASTGTAVAGDSPATLDFARLLLGQLQPARAALLEPAQKSAQQTDPVIVEADPADTVALLAALGLVSQESSRKADAAPIEDSSKDRSAQDSTTIDNSISDNANTVPLALQAVAIVAHGPEPVANTKSLKPVSLPTTAPVGQAAQEFVKADTAPAAAPAIDERPAIFAAATAIAPTVETTSSKIVSADVVPNSTPVLASNPNTPPIRHEVSLSVPTPVRDQAWASDFGQKIVWLASHDKQSAQITLNPPQMGPIEIALSLDKGSATASFTSANSEVRNALETAMPKLREMFASAGIELGQTNVSSESFRQQAENGNANRGASQWRADNAILVAESGISLSARAFSAHQGNGLVDIFA